MFTARQMFYRFNQRANFQTYSGVPIVFTSESADDHKAPSSYIISLRPFAIQQGTAVKF